MHYTLHQLEIFIQVTRHESITKAAETLYLTQPAVSLQMKKLQSQFDQPLFEVVGKKLYVTTFGRELEEIALDLLALSDKIENLSLANTGQLVGKIEISSVSTGKYVIPYFISQFFKKYSGVELNLSVTNRIQVLDDIEKNKVDFSLVSRPPDRTQVSKVNLLPNNLYLIGRSDFEVKKKATKKIFEDHPIIYRENGSGTRQMMEFYFKKYNIKVKKKLELTSNEAVKQAVLAGLGISIMPLIGIRNRIALGQLKIIPMQGLPIKTMWQIVWPKGKAHSPAAKALIDFIEKNKNQIAKNEFE